VFGGSGDLAQRRSTAAIGADALPTSIESPAVWHTHIWRIGSIRFVLPGSINVDDNNGDRPLPDRVAGARIASTEIHSQVFVMLSTSYW